MNLDELADQWRSDLASWAIPMEILDQAEAPPWVHPVALFVAADEIADSPSHRAARQAIPEGGSVLDVGCGGGRSVFAVTPPAATVLGVDEQRGMLDAFADAATRRGLSHHEFEGVWPDVAPMVPEADVVVCHHVAFNVPNIVPFLRGLDDHARTRVVIEVPMHHPQSNLNDLWLQFWGLVRPTRPSAMDLVAIARALGFDAQFATWQDEHFGNRGVVATDDMVRNTRLRLCLPASRESEVAAVLRETETTQPRELVTIWWDVSRG